MTPLSPKRPAKSGFHARVHMNERHRPILETANAWFIENDAHSHRFTISKQSWARKTAASLSSRWLN
jgi:hypothetical protein